MTVLNNTLAITITYQPVLAHFMRQLQILVNSNVDIVVVDNGSGNQSELAELLRLQFPGIRLIANSENLGIAYAQNQGIKSAIALNYSYLMLMDQDSLPAEDMVQKLHAALEFYPDAAAVGPQFVDEQDNIRSRFIQINGLRVNKNLEPDQNGCVKVDHLISSGSLIPVHVFTQIGMMEEGLFIDYVDIEWALRARSKNFESYGVTNAVMHHSLGEGRISFLRNSVAMHSPIRRYYQIRNAISLYRRQYIPLNWKVVDAYKLVAKLGVSLLSSRQKILEVKMIIKGVMHGARHINGRIDQTTHERK